MAYLPYREPSGDRLGSVEFLLSRATEILSYVEAYRQFLLSVISMKREVYKKIVEDNGKLHPILVQECAIDHIVDGCPWLWRDRDQYITSLLSRHALPTEHN